MKLINGLDQDELVRFKNAVAEDPAKAERWPTVSGEWVGGFRSRIESGEQTIHIGGDDELNPMQMVLAALAACHVDLLATHATMIGLVVRGLRVEVSGHFNVQAYVGLEDRPGSGYDQISCKVILDAPEATPDQVAYLAARSKQSSPVGDTMGRSVTIDLEFV